MSELRFQPIGFDHLDAILEYEMDQRGGSDCIRSLGGMNFIGMVTDAPQPYTIKIPRSSSVSLVEHQYRQLELHATLEGSPVRMQRPLAINLDPPDGLPPYMVAEYLPGVAYQPHERPTSSNKHIDEYDYGRKVAAYGLWLGRATTLKVIKGELFATSASQNQDNDTLLPLVREQWTPKPSSSLHLTGESRPLLWPMYDFRSHEYYRLTQIMQQSHATLKHSYPDGLNFDGIACSVVNDDLRFGNCIFDDDGKLSGIIDPYLMPGNIDWYGRALHQGGDEAIRGFNDELETQGERLEARETFMTKELVRFFGLGIFAAKIVRVLEGSQQGRFKDYMAVQKDILRALSPEINWQELDASGQRPREIITVPVRTRQLDFGRPE